MAALASPLPASLTSLGISHGFLFLWASSPSAVSCPLLVLLLYLVEAYGEGVWWEGVSHSWLTQCRLGRITQAAFLVVAEGQGRQGASLHSCQPLLVWLWGGPSCPIHVSDPRPRPSQIREQEEEGEEEEGPAFPCSISASLPHSQKKVENGRKAERSLGGKSRHMNS